MPDPFDSEPATDDSVVTAPGDEGAPLDEQGDPSTSPEHDEIDPTHDGQVNTDAADEAIDETNAPEEHKAWVRSANKALQKKLREAAEAKKANEQALTEYQRLKTQEAGLQAILKTKDPATVVKFLQEQFGGSAPATSGAEPFKFTPKRPLKDPDANSALTDFMDDFGEQILDRIERSIGARAQPLEEKVGRSESLVRDARWGKVVASYGNGVSAWREKTEKLMEMGMPEEEALMAASKGQAYALKQARLAAAKKAKGAQTPTLPPRGRSMHSASPTQVPAGRRKLADYFARAKAGAGD